MSNNCLAGLARRDAERAGLSFSRAFLAALGLEAVLLLGTASLLASAATNSSPPAETTMELVFEDTPPPPKEAPRPKIKPVPQVVHPRPLPTPAPPPIRHIATPTVEDSPVALPAPPPPPAQPIPQLDRTAEREAEFASKVKAAIQAAVVYPAAARNMGYRGKARVEFTLRDGVPHQAHIIQGSGIGMIDNAALAAVANARYPMTPESIKGKDIPYQVTVFFELNGNN